MNRTPEKTTIEFPSASNKELDNKAAMRNVLLGIEKKFNLMSDALPVIFC
jgi:hypothetical protein